MKTFTIYFELFGKKMKTDIQALTAERAKERLKSKIVFHKVTEKTANPGVNETVKDMFKQFGWDI